MWFRSLFASTDSIAADRRQTLGTQEGRRRQMRQLFLEGLEDRRLMAFNVLAEMTTGSGPQHLELAAINSDSQLDLVTVESARVVVRLGNSDGSFGDPVAATGEIIANSAIAGDFTNDGVMDLITSLNGQISLRIGNGDASFQAPLSLGLPSQWESAAIPSPGYYGQYANSQVAGDLNDDGNLDLVLGGSTLFPYGIGCGYYSCGYTFTSNGYVNVLLGTGTGSFDYVDADPSDPELDAYPGPVNSLAIDDLNNDGHLDVLGGYGTLSALLGNGTGTLQNPIRSGSGAVLLPISLGDFDGDGNLDTVTQSGNSLVVQKGQGNGTFVQGAVLDAGQKLQSAVIGDVDGDGNLDLVVAGSAHCAYYGPYGYGCYDTTHTRQVSVLMGDGQGGFSLPIASSLGTVMETYPDLSKLTLADLTGDGLLDLVTADRQAEGKVIIAANEGDWSVPEELAIFDATVVEGDSGSVNAVFTVTLTGSPSGPVTVDYVVYDYFDIGDNTAARVGEDYTAPAGTLTFAPGVFSQTIIVPVFGDRLGEGNETLRVKLSNPAGALIRRAEAVGTIVDNEPTLSINHAFGIDPLTVVEGDSGLTPALFTVTLSQQYDQEVTVDYHVGSGHIDDVISASGTLRFAPGETSKEIIAQVVGDLIDEPLEAFNVSIINPSPNAFIGNSGGYGIIEDNDPTPSLSISDVSKSEGNSGTTKFNFTLTLTAPIGSGGFVEFATQNETATASQDYTAKSGYVYFDAGQTTQTISIDVKGDTSSEADETFYVNLVSAGGATIVDGQGLGTIVNDDTGTPSASPTISIGDAQIIEGDSGTKLLTFTVSLSAASNKEVRVKYATANGTAKTGNGDYVAKSGTLRFAAGETSKTFTVTIKGDTKQENDEFFLVKLSSAVNGTIADGQGVGTILNDDSFTAVKKTRGRHELAASFVDAAIDDWACLGRKNQWR